MNPTAIPLIEDNEQRLAKLRRQLEDIFSSLGQVHDEIGVASEATRSEGQPEIANVLSLGVCNRLFSQLKSCTNVEISDDIARNAKKRDQLLVTRRCSPSYRAR